MDFRQWIHPTNPGLHPVQLFWGSQVRFIEEQHVSKGNLRPCFRAVIEFLLDVARIYQSHNSVQSEGFCKFSHEEGLRYGAWIREACRFDQHVVKSLLFFEKVGQALHEVAPHPTAEATIV